MRKCLLLTIADEEAKREKMKRYQYKKNKKLTLVCETLPAAISFNSAFQQSKAIAYCFFHHFISLYKVVVY